MTEAQKFQLVRSLFVHREDVIACRYEKKNNWGPAYVDYESETYQPVNDGQLRLHINGVYRRGVYSTALDNTCKWICADFDENENAFPHCLQLWNKLREYEIPSYIERSHSGAGYHLWIFFEQPVHAAEARRLMLKALCLGGVPIVGKIKKGVNHERSMDRLFPVQDELTGKLLGNLVCLPLFGKAVEKGNTCFIDDSQQAYSDQWAFLQTIQKVNFSAENVQRLLQEEVELPKKKINATRTATPLAEQFSLLYSLAATDSHFLQRRLREIRGCEAIQAGIQDANDFSEPAWQAVLSNLAVYGDGAALDLAHEFSRGYDMRAITNKETSVYDPEETQKKFMHKIDYLQRNGIPSSCQSLSSNWECPKLKSCRKGFIAFYGLSQGEKYVLQAKELEDQTKATILQFNSKTLFRFYEQMILHDMEYQYLHKDRGWLLQRHWENGQPQGPKELDEYALVRMLVDKPYRIKATINGKLCKWLSKEFRGEEEVRKASQLLDGQNVHHHIDYDQYKKTWRLWVFFKQLMPVVVAVKQMTDWGIPFDGLDLTDDWVLAPFAAGTLEGGGNHVDSFLNVKQVRIAKTKKATNLG
ncbi:TOTE conflict system archaeo-eukaryotic primase domain-containing protein [Brevibacillus invocatus]|uniref:TOTE conflict system archaeo-eukaryotic primase domain-containing protein n=1 Tax=Brevibacillus invocatus TaxID=173959 RepID=UPI00203E5E2E|nr:hypothetical protein [Brevibacillus invocatus]MCM3078495.1 hypothetical protein [Brevibacillus invocatus]MCM3430927.1 hypothetical protein [Brevibacillus invocatus]